MADVKEKFDKSFQLRYAALKDLQKIIWLQQCGFRTGD